MLGYHKPSRGASQPRKHVEPSRREIVAANLQVLRDAIARQVDQHVGWRRAEREALAEQLEPEDPRQGGLGHEDHDQVLANRDEVHDQSLAATLDLARRHRRVPTPLERLKREFRETSSVRQMVRDWKFRERHRRHQAWVESLPDMTHAAPTVLPLERA